VSIKNPRTGRYEDDFMAKLYQGTATVGDLLDHAQEIIVEAPAIWGTVVTEPVRLLLLLLDTVSDEEMGVHQHTNLRELQEDFSS
jgi:hypothetical protein